MQMEAANREHLYLLQCRDENDSLLIKVDSCRAAFKVFHHSDSLAAAEITVYKTKVADRDTVIARYKSVDKQQNKEIKRLRLHRGILAGTTIVAIISCILMIL